MMTNIRIGTRQSPLALAQTALALEWIKPHMPRHTFTVVPMMTSGDRYQEGRLSDRGGKALFTKELERALLDQEIDMAVHSMKDVETWLPEGLHIPCVLPRGRVEDVWICPKGYTLETLPLNARVGTSSLRRQVQILHRRPDVRVEVLRGRVETRLEKVTQGQIDAILLAQAGLDRLNVRVAHAQILEPTLWIPAACQGIIGIETRIEDKDLSNALQGLRCKATFVAMTLERIFLEGVQGHCGTPLGAYCALEADLKYVNIHMMGGLPEGGGVWQKQLRLETATASLQITHEAHQLKAWFLEKGFAL
jgi:hydroxymethylbilane synthase